MAQLTSVSGCGPIGLITAAVAHAYSARKIVAFDHNPERVEFAKKYISPITGKPIIDLVIHNGAIPDKPYPKSRKAQANGHGHGHGHSHGPADGANGDHGAGVADGEVDAHDDTLPAEHRWEWAQEMVKEWVAQAGLTEEEGFDRVIEATGSQDPVMFAVAAAKQGANCESPLHSSAYVSYSLWK